MPSTEAYNLMVKARAQMLMDDPFFGALALKLKLLQMDDTTSTAATDGKRLIFNEKFVTKKCDTMTRKGLTFHEVMHCVLHHHTRRGSRDPFIWNIACDYPINAIALKSGYIIPDGGLISDIYDETWSAEAIYNAIKDDPPKTPRGGFPGEVLDGDSLSIDPESQAAQESDWIINVGEAKEIAKKAGKMPAYLEDFIDKLLNPIVPWQTILWPFCTSILRDDYTWSKPNRAYISEDEYLPSLRSEGCGPLAVICDSSGSCENFWQQFFTEIGAIHNELRPEKLYILHVDTDVAHVDEYDSEDVFPSEVTVHGGGGTRFSPAFKWITNNAPDVEAAVYLTDLESSDFGDPPPYPVLWVSTEDNTAPFGQIARIELES
jgi:predicted metal-dependent peptidase